MAEFVPEQFELVDSAKDRFVIVKEVASGIANTVFKLNNPGSRPNNQHWSHDTKVLIDPLSELQDSYGPLTNPHNASAYLISVPILDELPPNVLFAIGLLDALDRDERFIKSQTKTTSAIAAIATLDVKTLTRLRQINPNSRSRQKRVSRLGWAAREAAIAQVVAPLS